MANGFHMSLSRQDSYNTKQTGSRRAPLTPSTVIPPSVNAYTPSVARRDSYGSDSPRATTLLAKVASHSTPRRTPGSSPVTTPTQETYQHATQTPRSDPWRSSSGQDAAKHYWSNQRQQEDGYISFPDYEKYWSGYDGMQRERSREPSSAKT